MARRRTIRATLAESRVLAVLVALVLLYTLAPILVAIVIGFSSSNFLVFPPPGLSFRWFERFFARDQFIDALWVSLEIAAVATLSGSVIGTLAAEGLDRMAPGRLKAALGLLFLSPLVFPAIIIALGLMLYFSGLGLIGTKAGIVLAHLTIIVPVVMATILSSLKGYDRRLDEAAASLGAPPALTFLIVTLPNVRPAIIGAAMLSFLFSFNDTVFALFLAGPDAQTLPVQMFGYIRYQLDPLIGAVSAVFIGVTVLVIMIFDRVVGFESLVGLRK